MNSITQLPNPSPRAPKAKRTKAETNAFRHPVTCQVMCLSEGDADHYLAFTSRMVKEFAPATMHEEQLAQRIADCTWRMNRMRALETHILTLAFNAKEDKMITAHPQAHGALATADGLHKKLPDLATVSIHEQRLCRQHAQALQQLQHAQNLRKAELQQQLDQAANLYELHKVDHPGQDAPAYLPHQDGFVVSIAQIESHIGRQIRIRRSLDCEIHRYDVAR